MDARKDPTMRSGAIARVGGQLSNDAETVGS